VAVGRPVRRHRRARTLTLYLFIFSFYPLLYLFLLLFLLSKILKAETVVLDQFFFKKRTKLPFVLLLNPAGCVWFRMALWRDRISLLFRVVQWLWCCDFIDVGFWWISLCGSSVVCEWFVCLYDWGTLVCSVLVAVLFICRFCVENRPPYHVLQVWFYRTKVWWFGFVLKDAENLYWIGMKNKYVHEQIEATNCFFGLGLFFGFYLGQKK